MNTSIENFNDNLAAGDSDSDEVPEFFDNLSESSKSDSSSDGEIAKDDSEETEETVSDPDENDGPIPSDVKKAMKILFKPTHVGVVVELDSDNEDSNSESTQKCKVVACTSKENGKIRCSYMTNLFGLDTIDNPFICDKCFEEGVNIYCSLSDLDIEKIKHPINKGTPKLDVINICDDDDQDNSSEMDNEEALKFYKEDLETCFQKFKDYNFDLKYQKVLEKVDRKIDKLTSSANKLLREFDNEDKELVQSIQEMYTSFTLPLEEQEPLDTGTLDADKPHKDVIPPAKVETSQKPPTLPPRGIIVRKKPSVGHMVYVVKLSEFSEWIPASVMTIIIEENNIPKKFNYKYKVRIEQSLANIYVKDVNEEQIAYYTPSPVRIAVGNRVISAFTDVNRPDRRKKFYAGITAESPCSANKYRYMIFFDNGNVQYCNHEDIRVVYEARSNLHEYFPLSSQKFIRDYFERLPERRIMDVNTMDMVKIELKGKWMDARVIAVDASLMEVYFPKANIKEWLYRGSSRILSMAEYKNRIENIKESKENSQAPNVRSWVAPVTRSTGPLRKRGIIYSNLHEDLDDESSNDSEQTSVRAVAKKSVARSSLENDDKVVHETVVLRHSRDEFAGHVKTEMVLDAQFPRPQKKHVCAPSCIAWTNYSATKARGKNPLIVPMLFGFRRVDHCPMGNSARNIYYESPCGKLISDFDDLLAYLHATRSQLSVDLFNFDPWVKVYDEFKAPSSSYVLKDLSYGKEQVPIPVVNSLDSSLPPYMEYMTKRRPTVGVPLNTDSAFLTGCDCMDDCSDRNRCSCWQRTVKEYFDLLVPPDLSNREIAADIQTIGYQNRRLLENVASGIYECNSTCKCMNTCLNRVVQMPLTVRLELFKTRLKGWGTRCLNDIPAGGFICVYIGNILTEKSANEGGKKFGDEYFAELDYIEVMEQLKPGYESGPSDPENEDDEESILGVNEDSSSSFEAKPKSFGVDILPKEREKKKSHRALYGPDESVYIMDAKAAGNIGRYLNHSCVPNIFVQNVFVDTHDLRFPWVAFFAKHHIRAGTELTWDYQYIPDSVPGKKMYCHCGTSRCRGRLL